MAIVYWVAINEDNIQKVDVISYILYITSLYWATIYKKPVEPYFYCFVLYIEKGYCETIYNPYILRLYIYRDAELCGALRQNLISRLTIGYIYPKI